MSNKPPSLNIVKTKNKLNKYKNTEYKTITLSLLYNFTRKKLLLLGYSRYWYFDSGPIGN